MAQKKRFTRKSRLLILPHVKKNKTKQKKGHQIRQLRATFGHSFGPVCGNLKELIFKRFKCLGVAGAVGGGGSEKEGNVEATN